MLSDWCSAVTSFEFVEAIGDQAPHALPPHIGEIHWRAGFVLALGHGVLIRNDRRRECILPTIPAAWWQKPAKVALPTLSLDHPAMAYKRPLGQVFDPEHICELFTKKSRFVLLVWSKACAARELKSSLPVNFSVCKSRAYLAFRGDSDHVPAVI